MAKPYSEFTKSQLADAARRVGLPRWETMNKEQLVKALSAPSVAKTTKKPLPVRPVAKPTAKKPEVKPQPTRPAAKPIPPRPAAKVVARPVAPPPPPAPIKGGKPAAKPIVPPAKPVVNGAAKNGAKPVVPAVKPPKPPAAPKPPVLTKIDVTIPPDKDLSSKSVKGAVIKDRIFLMVRDPFWLHAHWELSYQSVQRAEAALGQDWHGAKPIIRLFDVTSQDTTSTSEAPIRDLVVYGGCTDWYIDVPQPPRSYRADIGYISRRGQFYVLARSNVVTPPKAGATESLEENWATDIDEKAAERLLAMSTGFESSSGSPELRELLDEKLKWSTKDTAFGSGAVLPDKLKKFAFSIDAELIVYGKTDPSAHVTLQNEPVKLRPDGTFTMRYSLTDGRQIIPAVAQASDGMEERTIVLAIERNTKHLDPMVHDLYGEN